MLLFIWYAFWVYIQFNLVSMLRTILNKLKGKTQKNGKWKEYNKHAVLIAEGFYKNDLKDGCWKYYYETGSPAIEEHYRKGVLHGRYTSYYENGRIMSRGQYELGLREGFFLVYSEHGEHIKTLQFIENIQVEERGSDITLLQLLKN